MDEPEGSAPEDEGRRRQETQWARIRLWTRTSSYSAEPGAVDDAPATGRIADLSSITARTRSPPTYRPSTTPNGARETNHANLANGQPTRISARVSQSFERNRALCAKYGLDITGPEWTVPSHQPVQRVERPIRMRIRFWCHHCNTQYGNSRVCSQCSHQRCNRCVRHPPRRATPRVRLADASRTNNAHALSLENLHAHSGAEAISTSHYIPMPPMNQAHPNSGHRSVPRVEAPAVSQQESLQNGTRPEHPDPTPSRITKPSRVRVHHICHECQRTFLRGESVCSSCGHERCRDCPRDPPRRRNAGTSSSRNRTLEHSRLAACSESDDGGDEFENERVQDAPTHSSHERRAPGGITSPPRLSTVEASINGGKVDVTPSEPPEPPPPA